VDTVVDAWPAATQRDADHSGLHRR
jgi:hypothetical protein